MKSPLYLYIGPEFGQRNDAIEAVKASMKKEYGEIETHTFYLVETPFSQVMTIVQSGTLFSNGVCVVCKNAELIKNKDDIQTLSQWLSSKPEAAALILVSDETVVDSKLDKLVEPQNKKKFWEMFDSDKFSWVKKYFSQNGYYIEDDAVDLILSMVENNTLALKNECSRFFILFDKEHHITAVDVESVLIHTREESAFTLFNKIAKSSESAQKRFEDGLTILQKIRLSKENNSVMLIAGLASCFRKLVLWHTICGSSYEPDDFTCKTNGFSTQIMKRQYKNASKVWTKGQATAILAILASTDMEIRSSGTLLEDILLQKMLYEVVVKKGAPLSEYD